MGTVDQLARDIERDRDRARRFDNPRKSLRLTWAADYGDIGPPRCIVQNVLEAGSLALLFGESNSGKSTFALDIALAVARGTPWRGRPTLQGLVAYLALESANGLRRRVKAYQQFHSLHELPFFDIAEPVALLDSVDVERVLAAIAEARVRATSMPALLVVDTMARAMAGGDENDGGDMGALIAACDRLRTETGATVLMIHHAGKDSTRGARGHSSLRAAVDTEIEVSGQRNPRQARITKQRDLPSGDVLAFDVEPIEIGHDPDTGDAITACIVNHREDMAPMRKQPGGRNQQALLGGIREHVRVSGSPLVSSMDLREIAKAQGLKDRRRLREASGGLERDGWLTPAVGGHTFMGDAL